MLLRQISLLGWLAYVRKRRAVLLAFCVTGPVQVLRAQQLTVDIPYRGSYRCGEDWRDATLTISKVKGAQFEGTFELAGRLLPVGRMSLRQMREVPKVSGTFNPGGGVVVRWKEKLILRAQDTERSVMFQGVLSTDGLLSGRLDYSGCDWLLTALPEAGSAVVSMARRIVAKEREAAQAIVERTRAAQDSASRKQNDPALERTLAYLLASTPDREVLQKFGAHWYTDSVFRSGTSEMWTTAHARLRDRRAEVERRLLAKLTRGLTALEPSLDGLAAGAEWARNIGPELGMIDRSMADQVRAEYITRRTAQWSAANVRAVRSKLQAARDTIQIRLVLTTYIGPFDTPGVADVRTLNELGSQRISYLRKVEALRGVEVVPEALQGARRADETTRPTAEDIYDAYTTALTERGERLRAVKKTCDRHLRESRSRDASNPVADALGTALSAVACVPLAMTELPDGPIFEVTEMSPSRVCDTGSKWEGWLCVFEVRSRMADLASLRNTPWANDPVGELMVGLLKLADNQRNEVAGLMKVRNGRWVFEELKREGSR